MPEKCSYQALNQELPNPCCEEDNKRGKCVSVVSLLKLVLIGFVGIFAFLYLISWKLNEIIGLIVPTTVTVTVGPTSDVGITIGLPGLSLSPIVVDVAVSDILDGSVSIDLSDITVGPIDLASINFSDLPLILNLGILSIGPILDPILSITTLLPQVLLSLGTADLDIPLNSWASQLLAGTVDPAGITIGLDVTVTNPAILAPIDTADFTVVASVGIASSVPILSGAILTVTIAP